MTTAPPVEIPTWDGGYTILVDAEDAPSLLALFEAGVTLHVHRSRDSLRPHLQERGSNGERITLCVAKALLGAGPRDEPVCLNGNPLDCRRANWRLDRTAAIRVWNSMLLGVEPERRRGRGRT